MAMDPELKKKWIEALRSGKYKQGKNRLHRAEDNSYCCLGVLCEVAGFEKRESTDERGNAYKLPDGVTYTTSIPASFFGFRDDSENTPRDKVMLYNDCEDKRHKGFKAIATYIEKRF